MKDLGCTTNVEVLSGFVDLGGKHVIDVGCGAMTFTRMLAEQGATVLGVDPDSVQAEKNRVAEPVPGMTFTEAGADKLPVEDSSLDGAFFSYSLHHIPTELFPAVFTEVFRVLKPGGFLYVIEPVECEANEVMRLFHDEDKERAAAWAALNKLARPAFESVETVSYHSITQFSSWDDYTEQYASKSFNSLYTAADVCRPEVREAFERVGGPDHRLESRKQVMVLKRLKTTV